MSILIRNGRLLDPASGADRPADVRLDQGKVAEVGDARALAARHSEVIDATGKWITPGFVDIHVHLREPGQEYKEDIASGSAAAAAGGFTTIVAMPNTRPVIDGAELVQYVARRGREVGLCEVLATGAVTKGQKGEALAPYGEMRKAGAVALTDDGHPVMDSGLMRRALEYSRDFGLPILTHAEDLCLSRHGHMHEGEVSTRLGIPGIPRTAEDGAVARDIMLAELTGGHLHVCHVSTAAAVELIRAARARGVRVTGEAAPHHFMLTHQRVEGYDTFAKMNPPLREEADRLAVIEGLRDGTLGAIATDHAPHSVLEKDCEFTAAQNGIIGLQTALPMSLALWHQHAFKPLEVIHRLTWGPAQILGLGVGTLQVGARANVTLVDPNADWTFSRDRVLSKSYNSPWLGQSMRGRVEVTILEGKVVFRASEKG